MSRATDALDVLFAAEALDRMYDVTVPYLDPRDLVNDCLVVARACTSPERTDEVLAKLDELQAAGG